jgi:hypothetical protein
MRRFPPLTSQLSCRFQLSLVSRPSAKLAVVFEQPTRNAEGEGNLILSFDTTCQADRQTVLCNLLSGQYERPLRIVAFNTTEGWARDVTAEIASEALTHPDQDDLSAAAREFVEGVTT